MKNLQAKWDEWYKSDFIYRKTYMSKLSRMAGSRANIWGQGCHSLVTRVKPSVLSFIITKPAFAKVVAFIYTLSEPAEKKEKAFPFAIFKKKGTERNLIKWVKSPP